MAISFNLYREIKDKFCIAYFGYKKEVIEKLNYLIPYIESQLLGLKIYVCCSPQLLYILAPEIAISSNDIEIVKNNFAYIKQIEDSNDCPIEQLMKESDLKMPQMEKIYQK